MAKDPQINSLIEKATSHHCKAVSALQTCLNHAKVVGDTLNQLYPLIPHGGWKPFIKKNFTDKGLFSYETAHNYRVISDNWNEPHVADARINGIQTITGIMSVIRDNKKEQTPIQSFQDNIKASGISESDVPYEVEMKKWQDEINTKSRRAFARFVQSLTFEEMMILQSEDDACQYGLFDKFREILKQATKKQNGYFYDENAPAHDCPKLTPQQRRFMGKWWDERYEELEQRIKRAG